MRVNGLRYHLKVSGEGTPLLLLHGFTGSASDWEPFVQQWKADYRIIRVDLIGHGQTEAPEDHRRYGVEPAAADLAAILDALHIRRAHLLGYSMGGRLALSFALLHPDRVRSLILESSSPGLADEAAREERMHSDAALADRIEKEGVESFVAGWEEIPLFATQKRLPESIRLRIREQRLRNRPKGLAGSLRGMGTGTQPSWWSRLDQLNRPVLLIVGEWDEKFRKIAEEMKKRLLRAETVIVPKAGHTVHVEHPESFGIIVVDFMKQRDRWDY
ncbi:2-succinyl-6-hydroxy-2,4-cyclohexadiene-1-carboxylate synthase [Paludifilum halophilum]|uniref:Putative 2-succinyl-6-hydroxy-2,4-cyclohexadiene-1-carboxylate synthase n=1 Tax=Paludifilum halophilum TaxID=1642702 RepID=A0A235B4T5_9BACL|nr:2-succinyl-6-hydroxy-2,4-cyclohexadiene-1-carboxylate synthase [Paludifilum halophilum]